MNISLVWDNVVITNDRNNKLFLDSVDYNQIIVLNKKKHHVSRLKANQTQKKYNDFIFFL